MTTPIFLVSLPRSGSTLLQKMLAANTYIATAAEPWIMLPFWGMRDPMQGRAVYAHHTAANAINDFISAMHDGENVFAHAAADYASRMYAGISNGQRYFLDKTPRYYLMLPMLARFFPEAKFILLIRNPLAVLASICKTFNRGRFMWIDYWIDWNDGHAAMAAAVETAAKNQMTVHYEDLVSQPAQTLSMLCNWLEIPFSDRMLSEYRSQPLSGRMGDPVGIHQYRGVTATPLHNWQSYFGTPFRRKVVHKMLDKIGNQRLEKLGYPRSQLDAMLASGEPTRNFDWQGRADYFLARLAAVLDYRYWQARYRGARQRARYTCGYLRKTL